jgi:Ca2+/H+ antiporter, TMEM165/GDT1 family
MLSTITLAATNPIIPVWIGSTVGMVFADGLAIIIGKVLGAKLPEQAIKIGAAVIFFGFGIISIIQGGVKLPFYIWGISAAIIIALGYVFLRKNRQT